MGLSVIQVRNLYKYVVRGRAAAWKRISPVSPCHKAPTFLEQIEAKLSDRTERSRPRGLHWLSNCLDCLETGKKSGQGSGLEKARYDRVERGGREQHGPSSRDMGGATTGSGSVVERVRSCGLASKLVKLHPYNRVDCVKLHVSRVLNAGTLEWQHRAFDNRLHSLNINYLF